MGLGGMASHSKRGRLMRRATYRSCTDMLADRAQAPNSKVETDGALILFNARERDGDFRYARLDQAELAAADLSQSSFDHANLAGADLTEANLSGACLRFATAPVAGLAAADLSRADLQLSQFDQANLAAANLSGAMLDHGDFAGACLAGANLNNASLRFARLAAADVARGRSVRRRSSLREAQRGLFCQGEFKRRPSRLRRLLRRQSCRGEFARRAFALRKEPHAGPNPASPDRRLHHPAAPLFRAKTAEGQGPGVSLEAAAPCRGSFYRGPVRLPGRNRACLAAQILDRPSEAHGFNDPLAGIGGAYAGGPCAGDAQGCGRNRGASPSDSSCLDRVVFDAARAQSARSCLGNSTGRRKAQLSEDAANRRCRARLAPFGDGYGEGSRCPA